MEKIREVIKSNRFAKAITVIAIIIIALLIFQAGIFVGFKKAEYGNALAGNWEQVFGRRGFGGTGFSNPFGDFTSSHGAVGKIVKLELPKILITGPDNIEKSVIIGDDTLIRVFRSDLASTSLKEGDNVVVIGTPDRTGEIEARLIRVISTDFATSTGQ